MWFFSSILFLVGVFTLALPPSPALASPCAGEIGKCEYYLCREMTRPCGDAGYYLRFAYPYCRRFLDNVRPDFSVKGQEWLDRVAVCLQQKTELLPDSLSCHELETQAIASHPECYISTGFCEQSFGMKLRILSVIFPEVKDPRILRAGIEILEKCGERQRELSAKRAQ